MDGSGRSGCFGAIGLAILLLVVTIGLGWNISHEQPGRQIVASELMGYCRSEANTSPDKTAQLWFLRSNKLLVVGDWVNVTVKDGNQNTIYVRYFAGDDTAYNNPSWRCQFGLVTPGNHPEVGLAMARYMRDGKPFDPADCFCLSTAPPEINHNTAVATLRCDEVV